MVWKSTLRPAFSLFPDNTPECWALEKYYLSHKKSLIWLFLMETFRPQTMTTVPKLQIIWAISSSKKKNNWAQPDPSVWCGGCLPVEIVIDFRASDAKCCCLSFASEHAHGALCWRLSTPENNGTLEKEWIVPNHTAVIWDCTFASIWNAALFCHPLFHTPAVRTLQLLCLN